MYSSQFVRSLESGARKLDAIVSRREELLKASREAISLSSRSIVKIHTGKMSEADKDLAEIQSLLIRLRKIAAGDLKRYLVPLETEYVEAVAMKSVADSKPIPPQKVLQVSTEAYVLGLLDLIGELKRMIYDCMRKGDVGRSSEIFNLMEELYMHLSLFAIYDNVVQGVRRKLDVSKRLIEDTRSAVTEEVRRTEFMKRIQNLSDVLPS